MLTESDLLSALANDSPQPPTKAAESQPARSSPAAAGAVAAANGNPEQLQSASDGPSSFTADYDDSSFDPSEELPAPDAAPIDDSVDASAIGAARVEVSPESPANDGLTDDFFSAEELESAFAEVDSVALSGEAGELSAAEASAPDGGGKVEPSPTDLQASIGTEGDSTSTELPISPAPEAARNDEPPRATEEPGGDADGSGEASAKEQPASAAAKGLKFSIGKKASATQPEPIVSSPISPGVGADAPVAVAAPPANSGPAAGEPHTRLSKRLIRMVEAGLDAIHKPIVSRMPWALKFVGIWSLCTIVISLVVILGLPVLMARNDALSHLEHCLLALSSESLAAPAGAEEEKEGGSHASAKPKKGGNAGKPDGKQAGAKKSDHGAEPKHGDEKPKKDDKHGAGKSKPDDGHGGEKPKAKDEGGHGPAKPTDGHAAKQKPKPKEKAKSKKDEKPKDGHSGGH